MSPANSPTPKPGDTFELTIDSLSYSGGRGVGRLSGMVVFIPDTAPGDRVRARLVAIKPRFWEAELVDILVPSADRRVAPCPVFGRCGGCSWQHVSYARQVVEKEGILRASLKGIAKTRGVTWLPFVAAPSEFYYRNRVQMHIHGSEIGFYARDSRELVPVKKCWIAEEKLNEQLAAWAPAPGQGGRIEFAARIDSRLGVFGQVNTAQNEALKSLVLEAISGHPDWILDLYCGSGNLTFPLKDRFPHSAMTGIELSREAIRVASELDTDGRINWVAGDVASALKRRPAPQGSGAIVLDPPRSGCATSVIAEIERLKPKQIVYVSCNPMTFARDAQKILDAFPDFTLCVRGVDMFPQTEHVELVAHLCGAT